MVSMNNHLKKVLDRIDSVLTKWEKLEQKSQYRDEYSISNYRIDHVEAQEIITLMITTVDNSTLAGSRYRENVEACILQYRKRNQYDHADTIKRLAGILKALRFDYENGYMQTIQELTHAEMFTDFLEMADYFYQQGYKDPAAVMAGSVLEEHLRKLCIKNGIDVEEVKSNSNVPKTAGRLNDDLAGQNVYSKLDQKSATAWIDLRNKAAHGKYNEYTKGQVALMVQGIRDFLVRYPA